MSDLFWVIIGVGTFIIVTVVAVLFVFYHQRRAIKERQARDLANESVMNGNISFITGPSQTDKSAYSVNDIRLPTLNTKETSLVNSLPSYDEVLSSQKK